MNQSRLLRFIFTSPRFLAALIFICTLALYVRTTAPTLGGAFDSEEFQHVAYNLDIAHATGYPLYLLIGKLFTTVVPLGNIAYRMNLLSAVIGAATAAVVYLNAFFLTRRQIASIATAALFATNPAVWRQAGVASVGPLHLFLLAAILLAILLWHEKHIHPASRKIPIVVAVLLFGLGLAHHRTTFWLAIPIAILVLLDDTQILRRPRVIAQHLFWLAVPLLLYLYMPIFGNNSPWYSNTLEGFIQHISGSDAGDFIRDTPPQMIEGISLVSRFLLDSFGGWGIGLVLLGVSINFFPTARRHTPGLLLCLAIATFFFYVQGAFYAGEPDRYLSLPFAFLIYWFAVGVGTIENVIARNREAVTKQSLKWLERLLRFARNDTLQIIFAIALMLLIVLPFPDRFCYADWSTFDRVYKQWNEIFTLPIPQNATIVGNWGQLNAMRYMQRIEHRRPDLRFVGTLYDPAPQTQAAQEAFAQGRAIFISPGLPQPLGEYRYAQLGPLLEVRDKPQMQPPATQKNLALNPALTLVNYEITTALETYAPTASIAPNRTARVTLDWRAEAGINDFLVRTKLYDPEHRVIAQKDEPPVRGLYPASQWLPGEYVRDVHNALIPAGTPPGNYSLNVQVIDAVTKLDIGNEITLASFAVERTTNLAREQVFIAHPRNFSFSQQIELWGYGGFEGEFRAGENLSGNLIYFIHENIDADLLLHFELIDTNGASIQKWERAPISFYPTREWRRGEILKAYYDLPLPKDLPRGEYTFTLGIERSTIPLTKIQITP
jgi:hypothetical protein